MNESEYKKKLLKSVCEYLGDHYIDFTVKDKDSGIIHLYQCGANRNIPSMIYNPFEATVKISGVNNPYESIIKEKAVALFKLHFKE